MTSYDASHRPNLVRPTRFAGGHVRVRACTLQMSLWFDLCARVCVRVRVSLCVCVSVRVARRGFGILNGKTRPMADTLGFNAM